MFQTVRKINRNCGFASKCKVGHLTHPFYCCQNG